MLYLCDFIGLLSGMVDALVCSMRYDIKKINGIWEIVESVYIDAPYDTLNDAEEARDQAEYSDAVNSDLDNLFPNGI